MGLFLSILVGVAVGLVPYLMILFSIEAFNIGYHRAEDEGQHAYLKQARMMGTRWDLIWEHFLTYNPFFYLGKYLGGSPSWTSHR